MLKHTYVGNGFDRYEYLRYHNLFSWGDPTYDWNNNVFPWHYVKRANNDVYSIVTGDIRIWNNDSAGHIAVVIGVNVRAHKVFVLEQNSTYNGPYFTAERVFYYDYNSLEQYAYISGSNYTTYTQNGSTYTWSGADPVGWLHSTIYKPVLPLSPCPHQNLATIQKEGKRIK